MPTPYTSSTITPYMRTWQWVSSALVYMVCLSWDSTQVQVRTYHGTTWWVPLSTITPGTLTLG